MLASPSSLALIEEKDNSEDISDDVVENDVASEVIETPEVIPIDVTTPESLEVARRLAADAHLITCPYNLEHKVSIDDFNVHITKCRSEKMKFYPHSLKLQRCAYNMRHLLPEEELPFHEIFCKTQQSDILAQLAVPPIYLDVEEYLAAQKLMKQYEKEDVGRDSDDSGEDSDEEKCVSVTSEVESSIVDEVDDVEETMNRLEYLEMKNHELSD
ncbi:hypothetical protein CRE_30384 [Caenorhabditis remanei]|uniref:CHHC U11-48K-type domain-containing protein n=1 Tax=Caenorhabditis remanei TaxID=31234 RepID=E3N5Z9_CAERE|nr:hypothetical protein CRE_30384 [Caenorhabditis remanei]